MIETFRVLSSWLEEHNFDTSKIKVIIESPEAIYINAALKREFNSHTTVYNSLVQNDTILGIPFVVRYK